jgi:site-specific recombinase XerD
MLGRRPRTIEWYRQKMAWYLKTGQAGTLGQLTAHELKRYLGELRDRALADNTIHGFFEVLRAFASWADREGYPIDPALLRMRAPKVAQKEVETYSTEQIERIFAATSPGWPTIAVKVLLGTGMRLSGAVRPDRRGFRRRRPERISQGETRKGGEVPAGPGQQPAETRAGALSEPLAPSVTPQQPPPAGGWRTR